MSEAYKPARISYLPSMFLVFVGFVAGVVIGYALGAIGGQGASRHMQYVLERGDVAPILAKDPAFKGVTIDEYSADGIVLGGHVSTEADKTRLRSAVSKALGERRTAEWVLAKHTRGQLGILVPRVDATVFPNRDEADDEAPIWMALPKARYTVIVDPA